MNSPASGAPEGKKGKKERGVGTVSQEEEENL